MRVLGIDPGLTGALALLNDEGQLVEVQDLPVMSGQIDGYQLKGMIAALAPDHAVVELLHAMPSNGSRAAFSQGDSWGAIRTAIQCARIPHTTVTPSKWKQRLGLTRGATDKERKEISRRRAIELYPGFGFFDRKKDHNRAEAALIATYGFKELA